MSTVQSVLTGTRDCAAQPEQPTIAIITDVIDHCGSRVPVTGIQVNDKRLILKGRFLNVARLKDEWNEGIEDPELIITSLKKCPARADIFTFWQRLPDTAPLYSYYRESEALSAIPLKDFRHWWEKQINSDTRKKAKRPEKRGVEIRVVTLDDAFVRGVMGVFNETPVRRGKPFWHYGKDFETVKEELGRDLEKSKFIGAYHEGTLVGFVKLNYVDGRFANPGLFVSKLEFRNRYVNNALLAKSVELCCNDHVPYLLYTVWRRGTQAEFLMRHGFEKTLVPRYWVPLTAKGAVALKLGLHRNIRAYIPDPLFTALLQLKRMFYNKWYQKAGSGKDEDSD